MDAGNMSGKRVPLIQVARVTERMTRCLVTQHMTCHCIEGAVAAIRF